MIPSALLAIFLLADTVVRGSWGQMFLVAPWVLFALWLVYEISYVSTVRVDPQGVRVQNMLRRTSFGWSRVRDIDLRWQLQFALDDGRDLVCYGGPARARPPRKFRGEEVEMTVPTGVRALTELRDRWQSAPVDDAPIRREWDLPAIIVLGVIVAWALGAIYVAQAGAF